MLWSLSCYACSKGKIHIRNIVISACKRTCSILLSLQWTQASLEQYRSQLLLLRHFYTFTLLLRGCHSHSKKISGHIQMLIFFVKWIKKFYLHFKRNLLLLLEGESEIGDWKVSLLKAGQCLSYFFFKMGEMVHTGLSFIWLI